VFIDKKTERHAGAFITGGIAQANRRARAEALADAAESHVLDAS